MFYKKANAYWQKAGEESYAKAMFKSSLVENYVNNRLWQVGIEIGRELGLNKTSHVLDLCCVGKQPE